MGFLASLFGAKISNENTSKQIIDCNTVEERENWFARSRSWHKVPAWLVHDVVTQLPGHPPTALALFVNAAAKAKLIPHLENLRRVEPRSVACAGISGFFLRAGAPLAHEVLGSKRSISPADERAALARDCLGVALALYPNPPSAHPLLGALLMQMNQLDEALEIAEEGLSRVEDALAEFEVDDPEDEFGDREQLHRQKRQLQTLAESLTAALDDQADSKEGDCPANEPQSPGASRGSRVLVEYSKDEGKRGPDWMQNNVDPILGLYFTPKPNDPAWSQITFENAAAYQLWFQRALLRAELHKAHSSDALVGERAEAVCKTAFEAKDKHGLNPLLVLVLAHQYVEADVMLRGMHTTDWVAFMMSRNDCVPSPENIARFVIDFYGLQRDG